MKNIYDFIVIGTGIAGLNASLLLSKYGEVLVLCKKKIEESSSYHAQGGVAAKMTSKKDASAHYLDTLKAGDYLNNKKAVKTLIKNGPIAISNLQKLGVKFDTDADGKILYTKEAAYSSNRIAHIEGDQVGKNIMETIYQRLKENKRITVSENSPVLRLLIKNKKGYGIEYFKENKIQQSYAPYIVIATGGVGNLFEISSNPKSINGDWLGFAKKAGLKLSGIEFIQFHPTILNLANKNFLLSETLRGEGAILVNKKNQRFVKDPQKELSPRDKLSREIFYEQKKGPVYLCFKNKTATFLKNRFPKIYGELSKNNLKLEKDLIPITPGAHFLCGGIKTDLNGKTSIKNIFAIGECAETGVHGANRLASNSLLEGITFGELMVRKNIGFKKLVEEKKLLKKLIKEEKGKNIKKTAVLDKTILSKIKKEIKKIMWEYVGIIRNKKGLNKAKNKIILLQKELFGIKNKKTVFYQETQNLLIAAKEIIKAAQKRKKSIGCHFIQI